MAKLDIAIHCLSQFQIVNTHKCYLVLSLLIILTGQSKGHDFENDLKLKNCEKKSKNSRQEVFLLYIV